MPRERISYLKIVDGKVGDISTDGRWLDIIETKEGGARLNINKDDLEWLDRINNKFIEKKRRVSFEINENEDTITLVDDNGSQISFEEMMKVLFG